MMCLGIHTVFSSLLIHKEASLQLEPGTEKRDADSNMDAKNATIGVRRLSRAKKDKACKADLGWISSSYRYLRQFDPCQCSPTTNLTYMVLHGERYD